MKNKANKRYNYFAVIKETNKIVNGVDYLKKDGYTHEDLMANKDYYFLNDLYNNEVQYLFTDTEQELSERDSMKLIRKNIAIKTKAQMIKLGIDPYDFSNWHKSNN